MSKLVTISEHYITQVVGSRVNVYRNDSNEVAHLRDLQRRFSGS